MVRKKKEFALSKGDFAQDEKIEDIVCFEDYVEPTGDIKMLFSFEEDIFNKNNLKASSKYSTALPVDTSIQDNRIGKPAANGITPPIDGESFNIKRGHCMSRSIGVVLMSLKPAILILACI